MYSQCNKDKICLSSKTPTCLIYKTSTFMLYDLINHPNIMGAHCSCSQFLFTAQHIEKSKSGPSFQQVQIWNDHSQKQKKNYGSHPVLGLMKYTHRLADHNKVTQYEFKKFLILRTISHHNQKTDTAAQLYCTLSTYVTTKTFSRQNQKTNTTPQLYGFLST